MRSVVDVIDCQERSDFGVLLIVASAESLKQLAFFPNPLPTL